MYDGEQARREWRCYVRDMKEFSERVLFYTRGLDIYSFVTDRRTYDATLRNIELIGEAATHVPPDVRESHPDVPWREIIAEPTGARLPTHRRQRDLVDRS